MLGDPRDMRPNVENIYNVQGIKEKSITVSRLEIMIVLIVWWS